MTSSLTPWLRYCQKHIDELKRLQQKAAEQGDATFMFRGHELVTSYARYLIEYLNMIKKLR